MTLSYNDGCIWRIKAAGLEATVGKKNGGEAVANKISWAKLRCRNTLATRFIKLFNMCFVCCKIWEQTIGLL